MNKIKTVKNKEEWGELFEHLMLKMKASGDDNDKSDGELLYQIIESLHSKGIIEKEGEQFILDGSYNEHGEEQDFTEIENEVLGGYKEEGENYFETYFDRYHRLRDEEEEEKYEEEEEYGDEEEYELD